MFCVDGMLGVLTSEKNKKWLPRIRSSAGGSWKGRWERGRREGKPLSISFMYISDNLNAEASRRINRVRRMSHVTKSELPLGQPLLAPKNRELHLDTESSSLIYLRAYN